MALSPPPSTVLGSSCAFAFWAKLEAFEALGRSYAFVKISKFCFKSVVVITNAF